MTAKSLIAKVFPFLPRAVASKILIQQVAYSGTMPLNESHLRFLSRARKQALPSGGAVYIDGAGPVVLLVHGWGGHAGQWYGFADQLSKAGYTVAAVHVRGHEQKQQTSRPLPKTFQYFIEDVREYCQSAGNSLHGIIAHSGGGLCSLAALQNLDHQPKSFIGLCVPTTPYPPIKVIKNKLKLGRGVEQILKSTYAKDFNMSWDGIALKLFQGSNTYKSHFLYGDADTLISSEEDIAIIKNQWPSAEISMLNSLDHLAPLENVICIQTCLNFLN